jgi:hypothetical protein
VIVGNNQDGTPTGSAGEGASTAAAEKILSGIDLSKFSPDGDDAPDSFDEFIDGDSDPEIDAGDAPAPNDEADPPAPEQDESPTGALEARIAQLERQLAAAGQPNKPTPRGEGAADESSAAPKPALGKLAAAKAKLEKAREKLGPELVDDLGISDLVDALEEELAPVRSAVQSTKQQQEAAQAEAHRQINTYFSQVAGQDEALAKIIGTSTKSLTPAQRAAREDLLETARDEAIASQRAARFNKGVKPMTDGQALNAAVKKLTGVEVADRNEQAARDARTRARFAQPGRTPTSSAATQPTQAGQMKTAASYVAQFLRGQQANDVA